MPKNANKVPCGIPGCKGWAIHGSDPPRCSPHSGRTGAPPGNTNHLVHGYYTAVLPPDEAEGLAETTTTSTLDAEILMARAAFRRLFEMLRTGTTLGPDPKPLTADDYARFLGLVFQGAGTISRLIRIRVSLPDYKSNLDKFWETVLPAVWEDLGIVDPCRPRSDVDPREKSHRAPGCGGADPGSTA